MLSRLDERTKAMSDDVSGIKKRLDSNYVTRDEFEPVKKFTYLIMTILITSFMGAIGALVYVVKQ